MIYPTRISKLVGFSLFFFLVSRPQGTSASVLVLDKLLAPKPPTKSLHLSPEEAPLRQRPRFLILCNPKEEVKIGEADREECNKISLTSAETGFLSFEEAKPSHPP
ncbi:unnamed protein product [Cuscuta epithymum]|uniref:Uncharacterized protein n=1 Tax=Cuscuta epithymum TaxID=186058 RepID=A0AAV0EQ18_9ASTE|nr:unnamed protein product [Cuscuta epithymum]